MIDQDLKQQIVSTILPRVQTPAQYIGGELNAVVKDHDRMRGTLCLAFPDAYTIGMSNHGLQVLYHTMNSREDWACERVFTPWPDMENLLRERDLPLFSLETFTPLDRFDVVGFSLQYDLCATGVLTMLDLGRIPIHCEQRSKQHPLIIAGGPCAQNPEPMSPFIDLFVIGDGEESLPEVCDRWIELRDTHANREEALDKLARKLPYVYVPRFYQIDSGSNGRTKTPRPIRDGFPTQIEPAVVEDLDAIDLPTKPVVPWIESVQDRIALEIMRGCPWRCRFCQSSPTKRPLRYRRIETLLDAAWESYQNTGYNDLSLLSLSTSDYPHFDELMRKLHDRFGPLNVSITVPSLRVNELIRNVSGLLTTERRSSLTLAPEAARDEMRHRIGKSIKTEDLYDGCRQAFERGFQRVKLYFMCGLPGERIDDLDGILEMAESIARIGKQSTKRPVTVVVNVSNFVPKPHTPFQWNAMQTRDYFDQAHRHLYQRRRSRSVQIKCHDINSSLLEGILSRGDRRLGHVIESAWRAGARFDAWHDHHQSELWWNAIEEAGIDVVDLLHRAYQPSDPLPWDLIGIRQGRAYLERERQRALEPFTPIESSHQGDEVS